MLSFLKQRLAFVSYKHLATFLLGKTVAQKFSTTLNPLGQEQGQK